MEHKGWCGCFKCNPSSNEPVLRGTRFVDAFGVECVATHLCFEAESWDVYYNEFKDGGSTPTSQDVTTVAVWNFWIEEFAT